MNRFLVRAVVLAIGLAVTGAAAEDDASVASPLAGGDAPQFSLPGSDGGAHALADHLGKRAVVLAWFPKAFTGG